MRALPAGLWALLALLGLTAAVPVAAEGSTSGTAKAAAPGMSKAMSRPNPRLVLRPLRRLRRLPAEDEGLPLQMDMALRLPEPPPGEVAQTRTPANATRMPEDAPSLHRALHLALSAAPEWDRDQRHSLYAVPLTTQAQPHRSARMDVDVRAELGSFTAQGILRRQAAQGRHPAWHGIVNQFYAEGGWPSGWAWAAGKKLTSWGVGFGFRPLDVVQREDRRSANPAPLEGVPQALIEHDGTDDALTLVWVRPGQGHSNTDAGDQALALRWYKLIDGNDLHAVARLSPRRGLESGLGATRIIGDEWSLHGASLFSPRYRQRVNGLIGTDAALASADPMTERTRHRGLRTVGGLQWTGASGLSLLLEAWHDPDAYSRTDWRKLNDLTQAQRAQVLAPAPLVDTNVAWSSQAFLAPNLLRTNLLARLAWDDRDGLKAYAEWLITPEDWGRALTLSASLEGDRQTFSVAWRQLTGPSTSAYRHVPLQPKLWAAWRWALD